MAAKNKLEALRKIRIWSCEDLQWVLNKNELADCCEALGKRNIDGEALLNMTDGKLQAMFKRDIPSALIQKLSDFVVNINFHPDRYCDGADDKEKPKIAARKWGQNQNSSPSESSPGFGRPALTNKPPPPNPYSQSRLSNSSKTPVPPHHPNKPVPSPNFNKPVPSHNFNKPVPSPSFNKPVPPPKINKPAPPPIFNKPAAVTYKPVSSLNSNKPVPSSNFHKPPLPKHFINPIPPRDTRKPALADNFRKPSLPNDSTSRPATPKNYSRPSTPSAMANDYQPMGGWKSQATNSKPNPVNIPTNKFTTANIPSNKPAAASNSSYRPTHTKKPFPSDLRQEPSPPPPTWKEKSPESTDEEFNTQPEYLNYEPEDYPPPPREEPSDLHDDHPAASGSDGWDTDFDDEVGEEEADDEPTPPVQNLIRNLSTLFAGSAMPSIPPRLTVNEPALPTRVPFHSASSSAYPQPPPALDNLISGLNFRSHDNGMDEFGDDDEYSTIEEVDLPSLPPREYLDKHAAPIHVPESFAPGLPHRDPFAIPPRKISVPFAGAAKMPDIHNTTPVLPPREPYMKKFPGHDFGQKVEDDDEYEIIEDRSGQRDDREEDDGEYLQPVSISRAHSDESFSSPSGGGNLPELLRTALTARKLSLSVSVSPAHSLSELRDKSPSLDSKPLPKPPPVERKFSSGQRPLPPTPDPNARSGAGDARGLKNKPWYHDVDRRHGEEMLRHGEDGSFLLRPSARTENPLTLTLWYEGRFYNIGVRHRQDQRYALGSEKPKERSFASVDELVAFYQQESLMLNSAGAQTGSTLLTSTPNR